MTKAKAQGTKWGLVAIITGSVIVAGVVIYKFVLAPKPKPANSGNKGAQTPVSAGATNNVPAPSVYSGGGGSNSGGNSNAGFPLQMGSRGANVQQLQWALQGSGQQLTADGIFGAQTQAALQAVTGSTTVANQAALQAIINQQPTYVQAAQAAQQANSYPSVNTMLGVCSQGICYCAATN